MRKPGHQLAHSKTCIEFIFLYANSLLKHQNQCFLFPDKGIIVNQQLIWNPILLKLPWRFQPYGPLTVERCSRDALWKNRVPITGTTFFDQELISPVENSF